jgi:hypothetical protein
MSAFSMREIAIARRVISASLAVALSLSCNAAFATSPGKWLGLKEAGRRQELSDEYGKAEELYRRSISEAEKVGRTSNELAESKVRLANILVLERNFAEAEPEYLSTMAILEQKKKEKTLEPELLVLLENLAASYQRVSKKTSGATISGMEHALEIRNFISDKHPEMARNLRELAQAYISKGRFREAEKLCIRLVKIEQEKHGAAKILIANDYYALAAVEKELKSYDEAESYARQSLAINLKNPDKDPFGVYTERLLLSQILCKKGELGLAEQEAKTALKEWERVKGKNDMNCAMSYLASGDVKMQSRRYSDAVQQYSKALTILESSCGPTSPQIIIALKPLSDAYLKTNQTKAREVKARIEELEKAMKNKK